MMQFIPSEARDLRCLSYAAHCDPDSLAVPPKMPRCARHKLGVTA